MQVIVKCAVCARSSNKTVHKLRLVANLTARARGSSEPMNTLGHQPTSPKGKAYLHKLAVYL